MLALTRQADTHQAEIQYLEHFRVVAEPFIAKVARVQAVPWKSAAGPSTWVAYGKEPLPVFVLELDTTRISASKLVKNTDLLHDISTALGGARLWWKNSVSLGLVLDGRPVREIDLVDALSDEVQCALIVGPRGTGKTTLLQHVIAKRNHRTIVCDPKPIKPGEGNKWLHAEVVGRGGDFEAIAAKLSEVERVMSNGGYGERVLVIVDEYWITQNQVDIAPDVFRIVTLGREPGVDIILGTHSERVKGLGIEGQGDLRDAFDIVRLGKGFKATIDLGSGEIQTEHPGPFLEEAYQVIEAQPEPEPVTVTEPAIELDRNDQLLVKIITLKFGGEAPVNKVHKLIEQELPRRYWEPGTGAPFTYGKLATKFRDWEQAGLLTPPPEERNPDGSKMARRVTQRLLDLAGVQ